MYGSSIVDESNIIMVVMIMGKLEDIQRVGENGTGPNS